jgi:hypothetical protein
VTEDLKLTSAPFDAETDAAADDALARALLLIQDALNRSGITRAEMSRRVGIWPYTVSRRMQGTVDMKIKTIAKSLAACGFQLEMQLVPLTRGAEMDR